MTTPRRTKGDLLRQLLGFSQIDEHELAVLCRLTAEVSFKRGDFVFREGDVTDYFQFITSGRIKITKHSPSGKEFILAFLGPGKISGDSANFAGAPQPCSAEAVIDTRVLRIRKEDFFAFLSAHPQLGIQVLRKVFNIIGSRVLVSFSRLANLAYEGADRRLARELHELYQEFGPTLPFTREEIGQMAGTTPETAIRFAGRLKRQKIIRSSRGEIIVIDNVRLKLLSEGLEEAQAPGQA